MISIAMATYNGEKYLHEQLDSILNQTYSDFELIICDDCSKDSTVKILEDYSLKDKRVHYFVNVTVKKSPLAQIFPRSNLDIPGQEL